MSLDEIRPSFSHPVTEESNRIFLDPCHKLKPVRNTIEDKKIHC